MNELAQYNKLMPSDFDQVEDDTSFPHKDLESIIAKKTNLVPIGFDPMKDVVTFPHEKYEVVNDTLKIKSVRENGKNFTSSSSVIGSHVQRTPIEKCKGYNATTFDTNDLAQNKNLMQPNFDRVEDDSSFTHENFEVMQEILRRTPARGRVQSFTSMSSIRGSAEKRTLDGKCKGCKNVAYDMSEFPKKTNLVPPGFDPTEYDPPFPRSEVEVVQEMA
ncbi:hypothetical protein HAX54_037957 [Datura stramonium]|uniref:Uncharacterized protein n=1 Tax=Datura stramonium TaxID=4076 RepID=A0ABS8SHV0_DATST|nr:hypothetical protein [Datura stramonium]